MTAIADQSQMPQWSGWLWFTLAVIALVWIFAWVLGRAADLRDENTPTPDEFEASAYQSTAKDAARHRCAVPFCDAPVTVHKRVGYETWTFCLEHGLPYLGNEVA